MHQATTSIRDATVLDLLEIAYIAETYMAEVNEMKKHTIHIETLMKNLAGSIVSEDGFLKVMVIDNEIVGGMWGCIAAMPWSNLRFAQDFILFVKKEHRGKGMRLINSWVKWSKESGATEVALSTASGLDTERVCALYKRHGFRLAGHSYIKTLE